MPVPEPQPEPEELPTAALLLESGGTVPETDTEREPATQPKRGVQPGDRRNALAVPEPAAENRNPAVPHSHPVPQDRRCNQNVPDKAMLVHNTVPVRDAGQSEGDEPERADMPDKPDNLDKLPDKPVGKPPEATVLPLLVPKQQP